MSREVTPAAPDRGQQFPDKQDRPGRLKLALFAVIATVFGLILLEGLASLMWLAVDARAFVRARPTIQSARLEEHHSQHDAQLGWRHIPGKRIADFYGPGATITINADGFRGTEPILDRKPADRFRLVFLGDSLTMGYGVDDRQTYPFLLETLNPRLQTVNMGQGGYSIGQCYLWYKELSERLDADALIFAFIVDDLRRMGETLTENGYSRPGFALEEGRVVAGNQPVPQKIDIGEPVFEAGEWTRFIVGHNAISRTISSAVGLFRPEPSGDPDLLAVTLAMFDALHDDCRAKNRPFVLVLLPTFFEIPGMEAYDEEMGRLNRTLAASVGAHAAGRGIPFIDLYPAVTSLPVEQIRPLFLDETYHHYSPAGNALIARTLDDRLGRAMRGYPRAEAPPSLAAGRPDAGSSSR